MELWLADALDLFQHWILTEAGLSEENRKQVIDEWTGPPDTPRDVPDEESWAPSWWKGDEEASLSGRVAAMKLDTAGNRR